MLLPSGMIKRVADLCVVVRMASPIARRPFSWVIINVTDESEVRRSTESFASSSLAWNAGQVVLTALVADRLQEAALKANQKRFVRPRRPPQMNIYTVVQMPPQEGSSWGIVKSDGEGSERLLQALYATDADAQADADRLATEDFNEL